MGAGHFISEYLEELSWKSLRFEKERAYCMMTVKKLRFQDAEGEIGIYGRVPSRKK
jgi:hypothetical protein